MLGPPAPVPPFTFSDGYLPWLRVAFRAACRVRRKFFLIAMLSIIAPPALAQTTQDPWSQARVHIGPLALTPAISLTNVGIDTNVFNESADAPPKRDFTMTVQPKTDAWLHVGRSLVSGNVTEDLVYYNTYVSERSVNG